MTAQDNATFVRTLYHAFNDHDFDRAAALVSGDCELVNVPLSVTFHGPEGAKQFQQGWTTAFPDGKVEITNLAATDNSVVVEYTGRGTHTGMLYGPSGAIPATGRTVTLHFCDVHHIKNGKIVKSRIYYDALGMLQQLGLIPAKG